MMTYPIAAVEFYFGISHVVLFFCVLLWEDDSRDDD